MQYNKQYCNKKKKINKFILFILLRLQITIKLLFHMFSYVNPEHLFTCFTVQ